MRQIVKNALNLIERRIKQCGRAIQCETDAYSISYWTKELTKAKHLRMRIERRFNMSHNVIEVCFQSKKRVA